MCGIAGRFSAEGSLSKAALTDVEAMTLQLRHRGPDDAGLLDEVPIAVLGHRRLSIIDLAQGQQPMAYADRSFWITFNGEVYNYSVLKADLAKKGHRFRTNSDTEVILAAYQEWGEHCPEYLEGMFAFAILDLPKRSLFLARDHMGKKPLYLRWRDGILDFASELSGLQRSSDWHAEIDPLGIAFYLRLGYIPSPWSVYRGVEKLRPGECCTVDARGLRKRIYWTVTPHSDGNPVDLDDFVDRLDEVLLEAVRMRLMSEVPLGAFLSGGIDSGLVVSQMAKILGPGVKTTTVGFADEPGGGELEAAGLVARHNQTDHQEMRVRGDAASILPKLTEHFGEPFADSSAIPTWHLSRAIRSRVTVALTGDGGDEPFGGYDFRYFPHRRDAIVRGLLPRVVRASVFRLLARVWPDRHSLPRALRLGTAFRNFSVEEDEAFYLDLCFTPPRIANDLAPDLAPYGCDVEEHVRGLYRSGGCTDPLQSIMLADVKFYLPEDVLVKVDRMSMAHGLEVRSPLLSKRVVDLAFTIPSAIKVESGVSKAVLRRLATRYLPSPLLSLPKRGFHIPLDQWLRGELRLSFESQVLDSRNGNLPGIESRTVHRLWKAHQEGTFNHSATLWAIWVLSLWSTTRRNGVHVTDLPGVSGGVETS